MKKREKELIYSDQHLINKQKASIERSLQPLQDIVDLYYEIPDLEALNSESFYSLFNDTDTAIFNLKVSVYNFRYAEQHLKIGLNQATGLKLVNDQLPNFTQLENAIKAFKDNYPHNQHNHSEHFAPIDLFELDFKTVKIHDEKVANYLDSHCMYIEHEIEFQLRDAIKGLISNIETLQKIIPGTHISDNSGINWVNVANLMQFIPGRFGDPSRIEIRNDVFQRFKAMLASNFNQ